MPRGVNGAEASPTLPAPGSVDRLLTSTGTVWASALPKLPAPGAADNVLLSTGSSWTSNVIDRLPASGPVDNVLRSTGTTWASASIPVLASPGTSGNLLESNGSGWTSATPKLPDHSTSNNILKSTGSAWVSEPKNAIFNVDDDYTFTAAGPNSILVDGTSIAIVITMPAPATCTLGQKFIITNVQNLYNVAAAYDTGVWTLQKPGYMVLTVIDFDALETSYQVEIFEQSLPSAVGLSAGYLLSTDGTGSWQSNAPLLPVVGPATQLLMSDGINWISNSLALEDYITPGTSGKLLESNGTSWVSANPKLPAHSTSGNLLESNGSAWTSVASKLPAPSSAKNIMKSTGSAWISEAPNLVTVVGGNYTFTASGPDAIQYESIGTNITVQLPDGTLMTRGRQFSVRWAAADGPYNISITNNTGSVTYATLDRPGIAYCTNVFLNNSADAWKVELVQLLLPTPSTSGNILTSDGNDWVSQAPKLPAPSTSGNVLRSTGAAWESAVVPVMPAAPAGNVIMASTGSSWTAVTRDLSTVISTNDPAIFTNLSVNTFICKTIVENIQVVLPTPNTLTIGRVFTVTWDGTDNGTGPYTVNIYLSYEPITLVTPVLANQTVTCRCISITSESVANWAVEVTSTNLLPAPGANLNILESNGTIWESIPPRLPAHSTSGNLLESDGSQWLSVAPKLPAPSTYDNVLKSDGIGNWISAPFLTSDLTQFDFKMYIQNTGSVIQYPANTTINGTYHCIPMYDSVLEVTHQRVFCSFNLDLTAITGTSGTIMYFKLPFDPYPYSGTYGQNVMIIVNHPGGGGVQATIYGVITFDYSTTRPCIKCEDYVALNTNHFYSANFSYTATLNPWV